MSTELTLPRLKLWSWCRLLANKLQGKAGNGAGTPPGTPPNGRSSSVGSAADEGGSVRKGSPLSSMRTRLTAAGDAHSGKESYQPMLRQAAPLPRPDLVPLLFCASCTCLPESAKCPRNHSRSLRLSHMGCSTPLLNSSTPRLCMCEDEAMKRLSC